MPKQSHKNAKLPKRKGSQSLWRIIAGVVFIFYSIVQGDTWQISTLLIDGIIGILLIFWGVKIYTDAEETPNTKFPQSQPAPEAPSLKRILRKDKIDGKPLAYNYIFTFCIVGNDPYPGQEIEVSVESTGDVIQYWADGVILGITEQEEQARMVEDFKRSGDPCIAYISKDRKSVNLRFFRDRRRGQEWREQTVIIPTSYKGAARQEAISILSPGDPLVLDEDDAPGSILYRGEIIAKLPAKEWKRAEAEGIYGLFVEEVTEDEQAIDEYAGKYKTVYIPHIRIIWTNRAQ